MPPPVNGAIDRRAAVRRTALLLGGVLAAPAIAGVLAGCGTHGDVGGAWTPRALTTEQGELVATIAEHILPETDTPGARGAGVHRFIDTLLAEYYPPAERQRFLAGLADVDARARRACGRPFLQCGAEEQRAVLDRLDRETFVAPAPLPASNVDKETERGAADTKAPAELKANRVRRAAPDRREAPFFRTMKELTLLGYYTSQIGATRELHHVQVPGRFQGCAPLTRIGRTWAV
jgi:gluconate 2-dehydrogenase gamma chain